MGFEADNAVLWYAFLRIFKAYYFYGRKRAAAECGGSRFQQITVQP